MADEPTISIRDYIDMRFNSIQSAAEAERIAQTERTLAYATQSRLIAESIEHRFQAVDSATKLAADAVDARLEKMNEFRGQLSDQTKLYVTRNEITVAMENAKDDHIRIDVRLNSLEKALSNLEGRFWAIGVGFTLLSLISSIILHFVK